jgi:hypothetical protein
MINCLIESAGIGETIRRDALTDPKAGHRSSSMATATTESTSGCSTASSSSSRPSSHRPVPPALLKTDHVPQPTVEALNWLSEKRIDVSRFITNRYQSLEDVPRGFAAERFSPDYIKGVAVFD